ncbi:hypothetical protein Rt10032_c07g3064 [Rhodotorula toruloides]|uniref:Uncharacterized protein n=1 Tax=Rhodotorula toruloides TaxID=5286 RepID=A0A511KF86_RHOTO|nr:hypothetical protein Rt10032_c07g3064 [Rhodotorula toruloides]
MLTTKTVLAIAALATTSFAAPSLLVGDDKGLNGGFGGFANKGAVAHGNAAENNHANNWADADHYNDGANYAKANHAGAEQNFGHNKEYNHANGAYDRAKGNAEEYNNARKYGGNAGHGNAYNSGADMAEHEANNNGHAAAYGSKLGGYGGYGGHLGGYGGGYGGYGGKHLGAGYGGGYGGESEHIAPFGLRSTLTFSPFRPRAGYGGQHLGGGYGGGYGGFEGGKGGYSSY